MFDEFLKKADELVMIGESFVIATVVRYQAPISGKPGDRAIIFADGEVWGWIGGGCARPVVVTVTVAREEVRLPSVTAKVKESIPSK